MGTTVYPLRLAPVKTKGMHCRMPFVNAGWWLDAFGTLSLDDLVVEADQKEGWHPLAEESGEILFAGELEAERGADCSHGAPEPEVRWHPGRLLLDAASDSAFSMLDPRLGLGHLFKYAH